MPLPTRARVVRFEQTGPPAEVLKVSEEPLSSPGPDEILIEMRRASVNPADLNYIEGTYGVKPALPAVAGVEAIGVILACGSDVRDLQPGQHVRPPSKSGMWRSHLVAKAAACLPFPEGLTDDQSCMLYVNPPTAWRMLHDFVTLPPGSWIIQNAANSGVGRSVIQIARHLGWHTINLVRREELIPELQALGADHVVTEEAFSAKAVRTITGGAPISLALNAVGGQSALSLAKALTPGGKHVTYGAMSKQPVTAPNGLLIFADISFHGFWVSRWYEKAGREATLAMFEELAVLIRAGKMEVPVDAVFPLSKIHDAVQRASEGSRSGKVLLDLTA